MSEQKRSNFIIRADGNARIASGHLRRTLSIAAQLLRLGCRVSYVLADAESEAMLLSQMADAGIGPDKIRRYVLGVSYGNPGGELPKLTDILRQSGAEALLTDSYAVDGAYFHALREAGDWYLAYIDDFGRFDPAADLVVNYDPLPDPARYRAAGKALLGPAYAPLREQFMDLRPEVRPEVGRILITTGGTDPFGMAGRMAELIREDPVLSEAGTGGGMPDLCILAPGYGRTADMAGAMQSCDLAVSAGGTTLYELCAAGVPAAAFSMSEDQTLFAGAMGRIGAVMYAGDVRTEQESVLEKVRAFLRRRMRDASLRRKESERMHGITDGRGAVRIAEALTGGGCSAGAPEL